MKTSVIAKMAVAALLFLGSCVAYYPQVVDVPLMTGKGDKRLNAGWFLTPDITGFAPDMLSTRKGDTIRGIADFGAHGTFTAAVNDFIALQGYLSIDLNLRIHAQGALGFFKAYDNRTVIESYTGYGVGTGYFTAMLNPNNNYQQLFTQFNIGKSNLGNAHIDFGVGLKGGYLFGNYVDYWESKQSQQRVVPLNGWMAEPTAFFRIGGERIKVNLTVNYMWSERQIREYYYPLNIGMGVNLMLGRRKRDTVI